MFTETPPTATRDDNTKQLEKGFKSGDESAFAELLETYKPAVLSILLRLYPLLPFEDLEDIFQNACIYVWSKRDFFDPSVCSFKQWLIFQATRREAISRLRQRLRTHENSLEESSIWHADPAPLQDERFAALEQEQLLRRIRTRLTPRQQRITVLLLEGLGWEDIAVDLDVPGKIIRNEMNRIKAAAARFRRWRPQ
jgi:RNA polymerase sigma factor (sigma-70 family)